MAIIDGRKIAAEIKEKVREEVEGMETKPGLATVLVGDDPASQLYVKLKGKACEEAGIKSEKYEFPG
ncbi:MAG: bifunctional methylenetetrahydrofolate dehydrogenase/methenyltetrahydrofolate cyclohydrolase, partial [Candidatus Altiarchaeota archaeon]|nr:bifunctional methylenetetrahydrofolate dehydrogenase/methenyltetrahydrofolate cyclohydrolase [Candidatus Altiarchaeota archaeon]